MSFVQERQIEFSQPVRQIVLMIIALALVGVAIFFLYGQISTVFAANPYLNGAISGIFLIGVLACFWQVWVLRSAVTWLEGFAIDRPGHEFVNPPRLLASLAALLRDRRARASVTTSSSRAILDAVATRIDEMRDITRYITNLLILVGLLGTFWGLSQVVPGIVRTMQSLNTSEGQASMDVFNQLMAGLNDQLTGMGTAFASSLLGLAGSLVVGLLDLFASHGQNRFYRELEEWLSSIVKIIPGSDDGDGSTVSSGYTADLLDRSADQIDALVEITRRGEAARADTDQRLSALAEAVAALVERPAAEAHAAPAPDATPDLLRRLDRLAATQERLANLLEETAGPEQAQRMRSIDNALSRMLEEVSSGRQDAVAELRTDLARLTRAVKGED
ncbi:biopolymer transporter ExbB [Rhodovulum sp. DZ06]|uniref:biopolymer transporter ExbB n=1 Tax=Rhodovulum sp. DZ06 TaxID=3425126 RepID=UPI003D331663